MYQGCVTTSTGFACLSVPPVISSKHNLPFRVAFTVNIPLVSVGADPLSHLCCAPFPFPLQCVLSLTAVSHGLPQVSHFQNQPEPLFSPILPLLPAAERESKETEAIMYHNLATVCGLKSPYLSDFQGKDEEKKIFFNHFSIQ